jgi:hypothetical protein
MGDMNSSASFRYLIDANCLIEPYNKYYSPDFIFSDAFWNKLSEEVSNNHVGIINKVWDEVSTERQVNSRSRSFTHIDDRLNQWLDQVKDKQIVVEDNQSIVQVYADVQAQLQTMVKKKELQESAPLQWSEIKIADPWLIATSVVFHSTIVTFEIGIDTRQNVPHKRVKIPNVAEKFNVNCVDIFTFLHHESLFLKNTQAH